jgi:undecaprenyl-diphosphatase
VNLRSFSDIHGFAGSVLGDGVMRFSADYLLYAVFVLFGLLLLVRLRRDGLAAAARAAGWSLAGLVLSYASGLLAAAIHPEVRPFTTHRQVHPLIAHPRGQAFPSGDSTAAFAVALVVLAFLSRRVGMALLASAVLIGFSGVYVGVHYLGDILASMCVAMLGVGLVASAKSLANQPDWAPHLTQGGPTLPQAAQSSQLSRL